MAAVSLRLGNFYDPYFSHVSLILMRKKNCLIVHCFENDTENEIISHSLYLKRKYFTNDYLKMTTSFM